MDSPFRIDWANLEAVKQYAEELATHGYAMTVILRPGHVTFSMIHTADEHRFLRDAQVVYRSTSQPVGNRK